MRRAVAALVVVAILLAVSVPAAHAGKSTDIALGLASFAVFNQVVGPFIRPRSIEHRVVYAAPAPVVYATPAPIVYAAPAPVVYAAPTPPQPTVVQYPHGRYELQVLNHQYVWVWIPAVVPPPPPPPAP